MAGYGIIGCGYAGGIHADNLAGLPGARLAAAFDLDYERSKAFVRDTGLMRLRQSRNCAATGKWRP